MDKSMARFVAATSPIGTCDSVVIFRGGPVFQCTKERYHTEDRHSVNVNGITILWPNEIWANG